MNRFGIDYLRQHARQAFLSGRFGQRLCSWPRYCAVSWLGQQRRAIVLAIYYCVAAALLAPVNAAEGLADGVFASVNGETISAQQYLDAFREGVRETFYHGKVSEKELENFRDSTAQKLVNDALLLQQAKTSGIKPDPEQVRQAIEKETAKYRKQQNWEQSKDAIIASVRPKIEKENTLAQLEQQTRNVAAPPTAQIRNYYGEHAGKFTTPEKWNVSIILLKVDPSSPGSVWKEASELADELVRRLRGGENFEELARIHSGDESAVAGGNMGYIHTGMLSKPAQDAVNTLQAGQISEPVMTLQGVAVFRLNGIQGSKINDFDNVKERATELLQRQLGDEAWGNLLITLRKNAKITINDKVVKNATAGPRPPTQ